MIELIHMVAERRRMTNEERAELVAAIEQGGIRNVSEYARAFAARHDLNPQSVRTAITRLRRQLGLLERPSKELLTHPYRQIDLRIKADPGTLAKALDPGGLPRETGNRVNAMTLLGV